MNGSRCKGSTKIAVQTCVCVCVCTLTSPGIVVVGHSVCGLDGGEVRLQGKQLTGQVWHTAESKMKKIFCFSFHSYVTKKTNTYENKFIMTARQKASC